MGNPHCIAFVEDTEGFALERFGPQIENHALFPDRVNAEFVQRLSRDTIKMRVWERGSGETLACGTGACAAAVAAVENGFCPKGENIRVQLPGGDLFVRYTDAGVFLTGGAVVVFDGSLEI
jgi:carbamoyl-phosphate synthase large subunit